MSDIYNYIDKYGNTTFEQMPYNEVDILILSQIPYLSFSNIISNKNEKITLNKAVDLYFLNPCKYDIKKAVNIVKTIRNKRRYSNMLLSNYIYKLTSEEQFCGLSIDIMDDTRIVVYEGTDNTVVGWMEDFMLSYKFPVPAHSDSIKYINKVSKGIKNIIVIGHSKGGNLALVASMYSNIFTRHKIKKIYSLDGPGIRRKEVNSNRYNRIKNKYIKIIPKYSVVGKLLEDDVLEKVVECKGKGLACHQIFTWKIEDKELKTTEQSSFSLKFDKVFTKWLDKYSDQEKEFFSEYISKGLKKYDIKIINNILRMNKDKFMQVLKDMRKIDPKIKKMLKEFLFFAKEYFIIDTKNEILKSIFNFNKKSTKV